MSRTKLAAPYEEAEQKVLAAFLDMTGLLWNHTPNESYGVGPIVGKKLKAMGVKPGVPDCMIVGPLFLHDGEYPGIAIELKRRDGVPSDVSKNQAKWLQDLKERGWLTHVAFGARDAIAWLRSLGIGVKR